MAANLKDVLTSVEAVGNDLLTLGQILLQSRGSAKW